MIYYDGEWVLEVIQIQGILRRYNEQDLSLAFSECHPFDAVVNVAIRNTDEGSEAELFGLLSKDRPITRTDRKSIEKLIKKIGGNTFISKRKLKGNSTHKCDNRLKATNQTIQD